MCSFSLAQDYHPLVVEGNTWNVLSTGAPIPGQPMTTLTYHITGETTIGNVEYNNLYFSDLENPVNWDLFGYIREDADKKVWIREEGADEEFLLYDFSLEPGDNVIAGLYNDFATFTVDSVIQVEINGEWRDQTWLSTPIMEDYSETWTEGIGSSLGMPWACSRVVIVGGFYDLLCMKAEDELIYMNPEFNSCYINTVGIGETAASEPEIHPNPATDFIFLKNTENVQITSIRLLDISGRLIKTFPPDRHTLDVRSMTPGMYLIEIEYAGRTFIKKLALH